MPDLAASERRAKLAMQARPQTRQGVCDVGFSEAQQPAAVLDHKEDRRTHEDHHCGPVSLRAMQARTAVGSYAHALLLRARLLRGI